MTERDVLQMVSRSETALTADILQTAYALSQSADGGEQFNAAWLRALDKSGIPDALTTWQTYCAVREAHERQRRVVCDGGAARALEDVPALKPVSAAELVQMDLPPLRWLVDGILPRGGIGLLAAPPKTYKSYGCLQLCLALCTGGEFLGHRCTEAACLYVDLESGKRRPRDRIRQILGTGREPPENLLLLTAEDGVRRLDNGLPEQLQSVFDTNRGIGLCVIDVLQLVRGAEQRGTTLYSQDYAALGALKALAEKNDVTVLAVTHMRKMRDTDVFNQISGSAAMLGAVDVCWTITRDKREDEEAVWNLTGRDICPATLRCRFDQERFVWQYLGDAEAVERNRAQEAFRQSRITQTVQRLLSTCGDHWRGSVTELIQASRYFDSGEIFENGVSVGRFISANTESFRSAGVAVTPVRSGRERQYDFRKV